MTKMSFANFNFRDKTLSTIAIANQIIQEYQQDGFKLTLRQLYYQMVARDIIPNTQRSYKNLGRIIGDGRLAGLIDWEAIEDRTRSLTRISHWDSPADIIRSSARSFRIDKWEKQSNRIEIWVEKEALAGVLDPIAKKHDINFFSCRGYVSLSEMFDAGQRFAYYNDLGQNVHILHLGDHDPSGIDMTRDIIDRVTMFARRMVSVDRLALNYEQIQIYNPPPNPAKVTDSRFESYVHKYGTDSWELDALDPKTLANIIEPVILELRDDEQWTEDLEIETKHLTQLQTVSNQWDDVANFIDDNHS